MQTEPTKTITNQNPAKPTSKQLASERVVGYHANTPQPCNPVPSSSQASINMHTNTIANILSVSHSSFVCLFVIRSIVRSFVRRSSSRSLPGPCYHSLHSPRHYGTVLKYTQLGKQPSTQSAHSESDGRSHAESLAAHASHLSLTHSSHSLTHSLTRSLSHTQRSWQLAGCICHLPHSDRQ